MGPGFTLSNMLLLMCFPEGPTNSRTGVAERKEKLQMELWEEEEKTGETVTQNPAPGSLSTWERSVTVPQFHHISLL